MTASVQPSSPALPSDPADASADVGSHGSAFESLIERGFGMLRFPPDMEAQFQADQAPERLALLQWGSLLSLALSLGMLATDWMMVPDRLDQAVFWRLLILTPLSIVIIRLLPRLRPAHREWLVVVKSLAGAAIILMLCLASSDELAAPYLVSLSLIIMFNGGVTRTRFWPALVVAVLLLTLFTAALLSLDHPNVPVMVGVTLIMVSTTVFTLYGSYALEHEERTNWLMQQHEHLLLDQLEQDNNRLDQITRFDPLTDIANRRHFDEFLSRTWERARHAHEEVAVLMIDVDHFKLYNDHYGHPVGDTCLKEVAATLSRLLRRPGDLVARFGGEEFIAMLAKTSLADARLAAERVREGIAQLQRPHANSPTASCVTVSIGVSSVRTGRPDVNPMQLLAKADEALYEAKRQGRNRVVGMPLEHEA